MSFKNIFVLASQPCIFGHLLALDISNKPTKVHTHLHREMEPSYRAFVFVFIKTVSVCPHWTLASSSLSALMRLAVTQSEPIVDGSPIMPSDNPFQMRRSGTCESFSSSCLESCLS